jgi:hypothetical protein
MASKLFPCDCGFFVFGAGHEAITDGGGSVPIVEEEGENEGENGARTAPNQQRDKPNLKRLKKLLKVKPKK